MSLTSSDVLYACNGGDLRDVHPDEIDYDGDDIEVIKLMLEYDWSGDDIALNVGLKERELGLVYSCLLRCIHMLALRDPSITRGTLIDIALDVDLAMYLLDVSGYNKYVMECIIVSA